MSCKSAPAGSVAPQGGFPTDLMGINLSDWAALVQDVVASLQALPPNLSNSLGLQVVNLLQLLEVATGVGFCRFCCHPEPHCRCMGVSQLAPPMSWSQILEQTPGYGVTTSSGGVTTLSTSLGGMSEYVAPLPGLSIWSMPSLEASLPKGPVVSPQYRPPIGRAAQLRAALGRQALALQAPQMAPPIHQPLPFPRGWPASPYQQAVQPPGKSSGWESPLTPLPPNLLPQVVRMPMYVGGRVLEAEMITAFPRKHKRGPPSGRPVSRHLTRWVNAPLGHLTMSPQLQHLKAPRPNMVVVRRPHLKTL